MYDTVHNMVTCSSTRPKNNPERDTISFEHVDVSGDSENISGHGTQCHNYQTEKR